MTSDRLEFTTTLLHTGYRGGALLLAFTIAGSILVAGCNSGSPVAPPTGAFPLRAISLNQSVTVDIPASIAGYGNDTVRYLAGAFELFPDHRWRERWERTLVFGTTEQERRVFESSGTYRISKTSTGLLILELYPDQIIPANISPTAVVRGDTLFHGAFIFVR